MSSSLTPVLGFKDFDFMLPSLEFELDRDLDDDDELLLLEDLNLFRDLDLDRESFLDLFGEIDWGIFGDLLLFLLGERDFNRYLSNDLDRERCEDLDFPRVGDWTLADLLCGGVLRWLWVRSI